MTYYYPFGYTNPSALNSTVTNLAVTASVTESTSTTINAAFHALQILATGSSGSAGPAATVANCVGSAPQGPSGSIGPSGSRGPSLSGCPAGSVLCANLTPPAGYAFVCIQTGSCGGIAVCPETLP